MAGFSTPTYTKGDSSALMPGILDLWPYCGDDFEQVLHFRHINSEGEVTGPIDLTKYNEKKAEIRTIGTKQLVVTFGLLLPDGDIGGNVILYLPWQDTVKLGLYPELEWDLSFTFNSYQHTGAKVTVLAGKVYPKKEVTE